MYKKEEKIVNLIKKYNSTRSISLMMHNLRILNNESINVKVIRNQSRSKDLETENTLANFLKTRRMLESSLEGIPNAFKLSSPKTTRTVGLKNMYRTCFDVFCLSVFLRALCLDFNRSEMDALCIQNFSSQVDIQQFWYTNGAQKTQTIFIRLRLSRMRRTFARDTRM